MASQRLKGKKMTINQLICELQKQVNRGYGNKDIFVEDAQEMFHIDSVQKNTCPDIEPDYLFIMAGVLKELNND